MPQVSRMEGGGDELHQPHLHDGGHLFEIVGDPAEDIPRLMGIEVSQGQAAQLAADILPQGQGQLLPDAGDDILLHIGEQRAGRRGRQQEQHRQEKRPGRQGQLLFGGCAAAQHGEKVIQRHAHQQGDGGVGRAGQQGGGGNHQQPALLPAQAGQQPPDGGFGILRHILHIEVVPRLILLHVFRLLGNPFAAFGCVRWRGKSHRFRAAPHAGPGPPAAPRPAPGSDRRPEWC